VNVALTDVALPIVSVQVVAVPVQAPPQPLKVAPEPGVSLRVTGVPAMRAALHVPPPAPQLMPEPVTVPPPVTLTESVNVVAKVAVTRLSAVICTTHVAAVPVQSPVQPRNVELACGAAVRVMNAPAVSAPEHVEPEAQLMPPPETEPLPATVAVSVRAVLATENDAATLRSSVISTVQLGPTALQLPPQPVNRKPASGSWRTVNVDPLNTSAPHDVPAPEPQLIRPPVTLPPVLFGTPTASVRVGHDTVVANVAVIWWEPPSSGTLHPAVEVPAQSVSPVSPQPEKLHPCAAPPAMSVTAPVEENVP